jgi:phosphatidylglycerophosphate synthase
MKLERQRKVWLYYMGRKPSFYLTQIFLKLGMSANQVTYISYITGALCCLFLAVGNLSIKIIGVILLNLYLILDCTDGNIARYNNTTTKHGELMDALGSYFISAFLCINIAIGAFLNPEITKLSINRYVFLLLGLWSAFSYVTARLISQRYGIIISQNSGIAPAPEFEHSNKPNFILSSMFHNLFGVSGFLIPLLLLALLLNCLDLLIFFYSAVNTGALIFITLQSLMKLKKI